MEKHEKKLIAGDTGSISIQNVSTNPAQTLFKVEVFVQKKQKNLFKRIAEAFSAGKDHYTTIYFDRTAGKNISNYFYNHVTAADKLFRAAKTNAQDTVEKSPEQPKTKKPYKNRKKKEVIPAQVS